MATEQENVELTSELTRRNLSPLSVGDHAAKLSWKMHDILAILNAEPPLNTGSIAAIIQSLHRHDVKHNHGLAYYWGVSHSAVYGTLRAMMDSRGFVTRNKEGLWRITPGGKKALNAVREFREE